VLETVRMLDALQTLPVNQASPALNQ
jgi:hypothetical protein